MNYRNKHTQAIKNEDMMTDTISIITEKYSSIKGFTLDLWDEAKYESSMSTRFEIINHCDISFHCHCEDQYLMDVMVNGLIEDLIEKVMPFGFVYKVEKKFQKNVKK